ncbi:MAG: M1 family metallopeptidase [Parabacteroides sp.]|nr:M1 family metallopeptidase [Parabacteroides sp.]
MNRKVKYLLISLLVIALLVGLFYADMLGLNDKTDVNPKLVEASKGLNQYEISVNFDPANKILQCEQKVEYINNSGHDLTHLYFHLYPNAFRYEEKPVFDKAEMKRAYPNGFSSGGLDMKQVLIEGKESDFLIGGYSENLLMLLMDGSLAPGETVSLEMKYTVQMPNCLGRFGYGDNTFKVVNWYPIASVYDDSGWNLDRYYSIGDPFYSDAANYRITIKAPDDYIIASTGDIKKEIEMDGQITWEIDALAVRDFAWLASDAFITASKDLGNTTITSYYYTEETGEKALDYAAVSLEFFNKSFGEYPYNHFSVVESDFYIGGMEYPNLIMMDHSLYSSYHIDSLEFVTVHEPAHQWWYGLVGINQITDAWIDEGLTEYSTVLYYGHRYGQEKENEIYNSMIAEGKYNYLQVYAGPEQVDETIHRPSYEFSDWIMYDLLVYGKGAMMFHDLRRKMGGDLFFHALREYYNEYQFQNVSKKDMISAFNRSTGQNWEEHFNKWLYDE